MPRKTKEQKEIESKVTTTKTATATKKSTTTKKASTTAKKAATKKASTATKKTTTKKASTATKKTTTKKASTAKKTKEQKEIESKVTTTKTTTATKKSASTKKTTSTKKASSEKKATTTKKATSTKKASAAAKKTASTKKASTAKKTTSTKKATTSKKATKTRKVSADKKLDFVEYYDLPYRYNQTVVRLLAQTPNTLFIYWDISDTDRENFKKQYGDNFFEKTRPILIIYNDTMQYSYEVEINDFANSWYLHVKDSDCHYRIELARKPIPEYTKNEPIPLPDYFYITISNPLVSPNDHILFTQENILIRNIKTNEQHSKPISSLKVKNSMQKIYNIHDLYKKFYKEEDNFYDLSNPSSGNPSSGNFRIGKI